MILFGVIGIVIKLFVIKPRLNKHLLKTIVIIFKTFSLETFKVYKLIISFFFEQSVVSEIKSFQVLRWKLKWGEYWKEMEFLSEPSPFQFDFFVNLKLLLPKISPFNSIKIMRNDNLCFKFFFVHLFVWSTNATENSKLW